MIAIFCAILAGMMNGSFALPSKYNQRWNFENLWLIYALFAFVLIPWLSLFLIDPKLWDIYHMIPPYTLFILLIGGSLFGIGQVCFATALERIGFGLGFVITIGLGTGLGFLLPLVILHPDQMWSPVGIATFVGSLFICLGLILSYIAGKQRDKEARQQAQDAGLPQYLFGVLLAVIAGLFSAGQNLTFALTSNVQQLAMVLGANTLGAAIIIWPFFLFCSFIPYGCYMLYLHAKNNSVTRYTQPGLLRLIFFTCIMGLLWYGSLVLYSKASLLIGSLGTVVVWPLFMVFIILTSNFWAWRHHEWSHCRPVVKRKVLIAILSLIVAVIILAYSATLS